MQRARQIAAIEKERGSRVITMDPSPRNEIVFSVPVSGMIDLEDAQQIIKASRHAWVKLRLQRTMNHGYESY